MRSEGIDVVVTREPGGTAFGDRMRAAFIDPSAQVDPLAEAFALNASRAQLIAEVVEPALRAGRSVLCDRYRLATLAYQGFGRGLDLAILHALGAMATRGVEPDLVFVLDVPVALSRTRVAARAASTGTPIDRVEREDDAFHERVRDGYLQLAGTEARAQVLDGTRAPADLVEAAWTALRAARTS